MRLAYLCADRGIPLWGSKGASVHVRSVSQALAERGHDVSVVAARVGSPLSTRFLPSVVEVPYDRTLKRLRRSIDGDGHSVLSSEIYGLLLNTASHEGLLKVEKGGRLDGVYERYSLWSVAGLRFARSRGIPFVLEVNAPLVLEQEKYRDLELRKAAQSIERHLFNEADTIFVPSHELAGLVAEQARPRRRIQVTPNGVDASYFAGPRSLERDRIAQQAETFTVVFLGSLKPWHGIGILLRAFKKLHSRVPEARLLIIGDGPMGGEVDELAEELGRDIVELTGEIPHDEVPNRLLSADVGVAPYPKLDPFYFSPMKVIEYMASGLPVIASSIGQLDSLVDDGATGLLVAPGDVDGLTGALESMARDRSSRRRMGRRAQRRALRRYTWQGVARRIEGAFDQLTARVAFHSGEQESKPASSTGGV